MTRPDATVVVVDDDPSVRRALDRLLRSAGYQVEVFESVRAFLLNGDFQRAACLVLDVRMPGPNGLELQRLLTEAGRHIPIIFITGDGDVATAVRAMKAGAVDFLSKPLDEQELFSAIEQALARRRGAAEG